MANLIEGLQVEMNRVREIANEYEKFPGGKLPAQLMRGEIRQAEKAIAEMDTVAMVQWCKSLQEWKL